MYLYVYIYIYMYICITCISKLALITHTNLDPPQLTYLPLHL